MPRLLVACMGNAIRGDDGFGPAVARRLGTAHRSADAEVAEFGIAGIELVQRLMDGYDGVILVDAVDHGKPPGTIVELDPEVPDVTGLQWDELHRILGDAHETKPARVMLLARSLGCLPPRVRIVGCQPESTDVGTELSPAVAVAVDRAVRRIDATIREWREPARDRATAEVDRQ
jgi:hydrogenase maturation protease